MDSDADLEIYHTHPDYEYDCGSKYKFTRDDDTHLIRLVRLKGYESENAYYCNFIRDSQGRTHTFWNRKYAILKLNEWFKKKEIDPEYLDDTIDVEDGRIVRRGNAYSTGDSDSD